MHDKPLLRTCLHFLINCPSLVLSLGQGVFTRSHHTPCPSLLSNNAHAHTRTMPSFLQHRKPRQVPGQAPKARLPRQRSCVSKAVHRKPAPCAACEGRVPGVPQVSAYSSISVIVCVCLQWCLIEARQSMAHLCSPQMPVSCFFLTCNSTSLHPLSSYIHPHSTPQLPLTRQPQPPVPRRRETEEQI